MLNIPLILEAWYAVTVREDYNVQQNATTFSKKQYGVAKSTNPVMYFCTQRTWNLE